MKLLADTSGSLIFLGVLLLIVYVALLLVALAYNVVRDARRRSASIPFAIFAFLLAFVPGSRAADPRGAPHRHAGHPPVPDLRARHRRGLRHLPVLPHPVRPQVHRL